MCKKKINHDIPFGKKTRKKAGELQRFKDFKAFMKNVEFARKTGKKIVFEFDKDFVKV